MFTLDPLLLARLQFAFTISFHIIFPAFTIGLSSFLAVIEACWLISDNKYFIDIYKFWIKIFAITFGMGVVSGVVLSYQIGTNWSVFSYKVSNVLGPLFGYEVLTAFFLESSFLGIMLFGSNKVSPKMHFAATLIVAIGTLISAFWIIAANSFMQTPQGFELDAEGKLNPLNWLEIIFNPSFPFRYMHMITAAYLTTAFVIGGISALYIRQGRFINHAKIMLSMATLMAAFIAPLQMIIGDFHGQNTLKHQPAKIAAIEGLWENEKAAGLRLFALIDSKNEKNSHEIIIPSLASIILTHSLNGEIKGLKNWNKDERPPVMPIFWSFRIMVGIGCLMSLLGVISGILLVRKKLFNNKIILLWWICMIPSGFTALLCGWFVTELGRQPYTVYGVLKTSSSVTPAIIGPQVAWSLLTFIAVYTIIFGTAIYYIIKLIKKGIYAIGKDEQYYYHGIEGPISQEKI